MLIGCCGQLDTPDRAPCRRSLKSQMAGYGHQLNVDVNFDESNVTLAVGSYIEFETTP